MVLPWQDNNKGSPILIDSFCKSRMNLGGGPVGRHLKLIVKFGTVKMS